MAIVKLVRWWAEDVDLALAEVPIVVDGKGPGLAVLDGRHELSAELLCLRPVCVCGEEGVAATTQQCLVGLHTYISLDEFA
eukprot:6046647-Heterocapsa_arctica.AAC.1